MHYPVEIHLRKKCEMANLKYKHDEGMFVFEIPLSDSL